jgi:hypothetical protein
MNLGLIMNKEQQELLDEAYKNYTKYPLATIRDHRTNILYQNRDKGWCVLNGRSMVSPHPTRHLTQQEFINKCKTDTEFSERWGLKIEERELFRLERINVAIEKKITHKTAHLTKDFDYQKWCDEQNIPTKLITITYNDKTIESYERNIK